MPQPFDPLRSKFTAAALADFCATYYAVVRSFGNHWDEIRSDCYAKLKALPPAKYGKPSSFRLFYLRRFIEKAIELAGIKDILRFQMFHLEHWRLQSYVPQKLSGVIVDRWLRPPDHLEMVVYAPQFPPISYVSVNVAVAAQVGLSEASEIDRCGYQLEIPEFIRIKYISRVSVKTEKVRLVRVQRVQPHQLRDLIFLTDDIEELNKSLTCYLSGEITFELFGFHESTEVNRLSELTFYAVEPLKFLSFKGARDNYKQALVTCRTESGGEIEYRADLAKIRTLSKGQSIGALTKRVWNTDERFILGHEVLSENALQEATEKARQNFKELTKQLTFMPIKDILDSLPKQGDMREIGELEVGHLVVHPEYGPGTIQGTEIIHGQTFVECQFMKQYYKAGRIYIPATRRLPVYWQDLALLEY